VRVRNEGGEVWLEAQTIVLALGSRANNEMFENLKGKFSRLFPVGDCLEPRRAKEAIHEGFTTALRV
jgi:2,4-dienoyl-CoA reductase (NADPH2)